MKSSRLAVSCYSLVTSFDLTVRHSNNSICNCARRESFHLITYVFHNVADACNGCLWIRVRNSGSHWSGLECIHNYLSLHSYI